MFTATTHMKIITVKVKVRFLATMITRQKTTKKFRT